MSSASPDQRGPTFADAQLVQRCRAGDERAWHELVEHFSRYVYAIAIQGFRLSPDDAQDAFQDVFLRVYDRLDTLKNDEALRPWIGQLTRRVCLDRLAAGRRQQTGELREVVDVVETLNPLEEAMDVHDALASLEDPCRELLDRFFARDQSYRTICAALDIPIGTVASRISRCLAKLRKTLEGSKPAPRASSEEWRE